MKTIREINFFEDEELLRQMSFVSLILLAIPVLFLIAVICVLTFRDGEGFLAFAEVVDGMNIIMWVVALILVNVAAVFVHELIHAAYFKRYAPDAEMTFGIKDDMILTGCPGTVFTRSQMFNILIAPAAWMTLVFALAAFLGAPSVLCCLSLFIHLAGCAGDLISAWTIKQEPRCTHCEDTLVGIKLLGDN